MSCCVLILSTVDSSKKTSALDVFVGDQVQYGSHLFTMTYICRRSLGLASSEEDSMEASWEEIKTYNRSCRTVSQLVCSLKNVDFDNSTLLLGT